MAASIKVSNKYLIKKDITVPTRTSQTDTSTNGSC